VLHCQHHCTKGGKEASPWHGLRILRRFIGEINRMILVDISVSFLVGGFNHLVKYESQWEGLSHILWKIKNV